MSASKDKFHFGVGLTILIAIAVLVALLCTVFTPNYFRPKTIVETYFTESVNGLSPGAPVKFKGVDIGKVTDISLSSKIYSSHHINLFSPNKSVAVVRMIVYMDENELKAQAQKLVEEGLRVQTELAGVTGTLYLAANFLDPKLYPPEVTQVPWNPKHIYIPATISLSNEIMENVQNFFATLQGIKTKIDETTPSTAKNRSIKELLTELNNTVSVLDPSKLKVLLANAEDYVNSSEKILSKVDVAQINEMLRQLLDTTDKLNAAIEDTKTSGLLKQINKTISGADRSLADNRYNIRELLLNLKDITENLKILTGELAQSPDVLMRRSSSSPFSKEK